MGSCEHQVTMYHPVHGKGRVTNLTPHLDMEDSLRIPTHYPRCPRTINLCLRGSVMILASQTLNYLDALRGEFVANEGATCLGE